MQISQLRDEKKVSQWDFSPRHELGEPLKPIVKVLNITASKIHVNSYQYVNNNAHGEG